MIKYVLFFFLNLFLIPNSFWTVLLWREENKHYDSNHLAVFHFLFSAELLSKCFHFLSILGPAEVCSPSIRLLSPHAHSSVRGFMYPGLNLCPHFTFSSDFLSASHSQPPIKSCQHLSPIWSSQTPCLWVLFVCLFKSTIRVRHKYCGMISFSYSNK